MGGESLADRTMEGMVEIGRGWEMALGRISQCFRDLILSIYAFIPNPRGDGAYLENEMSGFLAVWLVVKGHWVFTRFESEHVTSLYAVLVA